MRLTGSWLDLSAAVDVYSEWVDACDAVAKENSEEASDRHTSTHRPQAARGSVAAHQGMEHDPDDDEGGGYEGEGIVADDDY
jgi:transcription elongation factor Elf1